MSLVYLNFCAIALSMTSNSDFEKILYCLRSFEQVYVITGGGPLNSTNLLVYYIYEEAFARFEFGYAAAATVLLGITLVLVYFQLRTWGEEG